jgi:hypothetical protein
MATPSDSSSPQLTDDLPAPPSGSSQMCMDRPLGERPSPLAGSEPPWGRRVSVAVTGSLRLRPQNDAPLLANGPRVHI